MGLGYPTTSGTYESQQFGPVPYGVPGYFSQPAMYASGSTVAWWQPYKQWSYYEHFHNGLDVAGPEGLALRAIETGRVIFSGWKTNGGGWVIEVEIRPGTRYTFNHCQKLLAPIGARVSRGQIIATIGSSGTATGDHCHLSLDILEQGPDGVSRWLVWNPKYFMVGGPYQYDPRIAPLTYEPKPPAPIIYPSTEGDNVMALRYLYDSGYITIKAGKPYRDGPTVNARILGYFTEDTKLRKIGKPKQPTGDGFDPWSLSDVYRGNGYGLIWVTGKDKV